jgi:hypothetical protein
MFPVPDLLLEFLPLSATKVGVGFTEFSGENFCARNPHRAHKNTPNSSGCTYIHCWILIIEV